MHSCGSRREVGRSGRREAAPGGRAPGGRAPVIAPGPATLPLNRCRATLGEAGKAGRAGSGGGQQAHLVVRTSTRIDRRIASQRGLASSCNGPAGGASRAARRRQSMCCSIQEVVGNAPRMRERRCTCGQHRAALAASAQFDSTRATVLQPPARQAPLHTIAEGATHARFPFSVAGASRHLLRKSRCHWCTHRFGLQAEAGCKRVKAPTWSWAGCPSAPATAAHRAPAVLATPRPCGAVPAASESP